MTKSDDKRVPALRFKGFTDEWEQRKLGEISNIIAGGDKNINKIKKYGKYPVIANSINKNGIVGYYDNEYRVKAPAVTVTGRGEIGHAVARFQNFTPIVRLLALSSKLDPIFLANSINKIRFFNESTGVPQLTKPQLSTYSIIIPSVEEQNNIGKLILLIEKYIHLQQRKLDILIKLNRNIIINLFKEIRVNHHAIELKHTASNWKSARLKELGICQSGFGFPIKEQNGSKGIPFFKVSDFNTFGNEIYLQYANNYVTNHQIRKNKWKIFDQVPAIVFAKVGAAIFLNRKRMINEPFLIDNNLMAFELNLQKLDYKFAKILFDNMYLPKFAQVGALPSYNASDINAIKVKIPDMDSQKKIANIIMKNNNEIILQKQILQKGKELKQFLLQNMFI